MGTYIEAAATAHGHAHWFGGGARHLTDVAAEICLERAHHTADDIDLLVNAGIYKDLNVAEPALAAIVQDDIGANRGDPPRFGHHGTFSFDVLNGGCGVVSAAQLVDALVGHGDARLGLIVAADTDPSPRTSRGFAFAPAGGALLLSHREDDEHGFVRFATRTFPEYAGLFESHLRWDPQAGFTHHGRNILEVYEAPAFLGAAVEAATAVCHELLATCDLRPGDVDLVIASQYPPTFGQELVRILGISSERIPAVEPSLVGTHTAGPIAALECAFLSRKLARARNVLVVTCGAGLTIAAAVYRP